MVAQFYKQTTRLFQISKFFYSFNFRRGSAVYKSDNLSTIIILRDVISKVVTAKQLKVQISCGNYTNIEFLIIKMHIRF